MHELGLVVEMIEAVKEVVQNQPEVQVVSVHVRVGALRAIEPEVMRFCWDAATQETVAEGAVLCLETVPASGFCRECDYTFEVCDWIFVCPICNGGHVETVGGKDLVLERVVFTLEQGRKRKSHFSGGG